jgi:hypothetical protein
LRKRWSSHSHSLSLIVVQTKIYSLLPSLRFENREEESW